MDHHAAQTGVAQRLLNTVRLPGYRGRGRRAVRNAGDPTLTSSETFMRTAKLIHCTLVITAGMSFCGTVYADTCTGRSNNVAISAETLEVPDGHTMTVFVANSIGTSENFPPLDSTFGKCGGYSVTTPDGKTRVVGVCVRQNKNGDSWADELVLEPGAERGTWTQFEGTGAFAGKNWSGWWQPVRDEGAMFSGTWGGDCN